MKEQYSRTRGGEYQTSTSIPGEQEAYESCDTLQNVGLCVSAMSGFNELDVKNNLRADSLFTSRQRGEITAASFPHRRSRFFFCHTSVTATFCGKKPEPKGTKVKKGRRASSTFECDTIYIKLESLC